MKRRTVLAGSALALAGCSSDALEGPEAADAEAEIRDRLAGLRDSEGLSELSARDALATAARGHSRDMHERDFYAHENPDGAGPSDRAGCRAGEVIHRGEIGEMRNRGSDETYDTYAADELAAYVVDGWRLSEPHFETITLPRWAAIGVGVYIGDGEFFATAMFC